MRYSRLHFTAATVLAMAACQIDRSTGQDTASTVAPVTADDDPADPCAASPTVVVTPAVIPPTPTGVAVALDVAVTNANPAACPVRRFQLVIADTGLLFEPRPSTKPTTAPLELASGATGHFPVTATAPASADAGDVLAVVLSLLDPDTTGGPSGPGGGTGDPVPTPPKTLVASPTLPALPAIAFPVAATPGCQVSTSHELMITSVSVVDDPVRTVFDPASDDPRNGVWTLAYLAQHMDATPGDAPAMIEALLTSFTQPQAINGFTVAPRPGLQSIVLAGWPRTADGALDLARAPLHLQAIVNRFDLRDLASGDAGEGRFVFAFDPAPGAPPSAQPQATIIFEYKLPAAHDRDVLAWAEAFHRLGGLPFGEDYNATLQAITTQFARRGARPDHPNGSAINAVRTNEIPFGNDGQWQLREFHLAPRSGRLEPATLALTPDASFNNSTALAAYITANQAAIIAETHTVPETLDGQPFQAGAIFNVFTVGNTWTAPGVDLEARHHFAINTCNGCHSAQETGTVFLHLTPRELGAEAPRSRWLTGTVVDDPVTGAPRSFDDLGRRKADLRAIVCRDSAMPARDRLRRGIRRVH